jgi:hypothetical protein
MLMQFKSLYSHIILAWTICPGDKIRILKVLAQLEFMVTTANYALHAT